MNSPEDKGAALERRFQTAQQKWQQEYEQISKVIVPEMIQFLAELGTEGERSAVVLGAERVNVAVEHLVKAFLRPAPTKNDTLFSADGALATFSRKNEIAYRLGLIDLGFKRALDLVRRLRNDFAHATKVETLEGQKHADKVRELRKLVAADGKKSLEEMELAFVKGAGSSELATAYLACIMILLGKLELTRHRLKRPKIRLPVKLNYQDPD